MSEQFAEFENRLRKALAPVEPPAELEARLEINLASIVDLAGRTLRDLAREARRVADDVF
jgi:hypothetical protein